MLFGEMKILGTMSIKQLLFDDLAEVVLPADQLLDPGNSDVEIPSDPRFQIAKQMDIFNARAGQVSLRDMFKSLTLRETAHSSIVVH